MPVNLHQQLEATFPNPFKRVHQETESHLSPQTGAVTNGKAFSITSYSRDSTSQRRKKIVITRVVTGSYSLDSLGKNFESHAFKYLYLMKIIPPFLETFHQQNLATILL